MAKDYAPGLTVTQILLGIQSLVRHEGKGCAFTFGACCSFVQLDEPNPLSVANDGPWQVYNRSVAEYKARVRSFVADYKRTHGS